MVELRGIELLTSAAISPAGAFLDWSRRPFPGAVSPAEPRVRPSPSCQQKQWNKGSDHHATRVSRVLSVRPGVASPERNRIGERRTAWRKGFHAHGRMEPRTCHQLCGVGTTGRPLTLAGL